MYDNPQTGIYQFASKDFGASAGVTTHSICGPAGKKGKLRDIGVAITEATVFATTLGHVQVGISTDLDAYGKLNIATGTAAQTVFNSGDDTDAIIDADIPADSVVTVTLTEGTGAGLAGQGAPVVVIDWI
jgi:hypothetical protein